MPGRTLGRRVAPRAAIFVAAGLLAALIVAPADAQSDDRPFSWTGRAGTFGIGLAINTDPTLIPIQEFIRGELPQADSEWLGSGIIRGRAAPLYPGTSGTGGPGLTCEFGMPCQQMSENLGMPFPPPYPLVAEAQYPSAPDETSQDGLARARATPDGIVAVASVTDNENAGGFLDLFDPVIDIGAAESRTTQEFVDGELVVRASSRVTDITLPGGMLHIGSVEARSVSRADGETAGSDAALVIEDASLAGIPISITDQGLVVDDNVLGPAGRSEFESAVQLLEDELKLRIRALGPTYEDTGLGSSAHVTGLLISMDVPVSDPDVLEIPSFPCPAQLPAPCDPNAFLVTYEVSFAIASTNTAAHANNASFGGGAGPIPLPGGNDPNVGSGPPPAIAPDVTPPVTSGPPSTDGTGEVPGPVVDEGAISGGGLTAGGPVGEIDQEAVNNLLASLAIDLEWAHLYPLVVLWALIMFVPFRLLRFVERRTRSALPKPST